MQITTNMPANSVDELLAYDDVAFIGCAYKSLLNRAPDPAGFNNYLRILRDGSSKMRIVTRMRYSKEGRSQHRRLPGLLLKTIQYALASSWLTGWWFRAITRIEGDSPIECRLRSIQGSLMRLAEERDREAEQIDASVSDVTQLLKAFTGTQS